MNLIVTTKQGGYDLVAEVTLIGNDILVSIYGGDTPHIGAVAAAQSRPSLKKGEKSSASTSVLCFLGHKEDELAKYVANSLASACNTNVVVCAGAHWDGISQNGIKAVMENSQILTVKLIKEIKKHTK